MTRGSIRNSWYVLFVSFSISVWKGVTSSCQIYFGESKAIYYPHGDLPLSGPTCPAQYNFAFPYQTSQTCPHLFHKMTTPSPQEKIIPGLFGNYEKCDKPARVVFKPLPLPIVWGPTVQGPICLEPSAKFAKFAKQCKSQRAVLAVLEARFATNSDLF